MTGSIDGVIGLHHVAIAVLDLDAALARWQPLLGGTPPDLRRVMPDQGVEAAAFDRGAQSVELIAPHGESAALRRFIERRGEGLHHMALAVADIDRAVASATAAGLRVIDATPRAGLHGAPVVFLHPSASGGVLVELMETGGEPLGAAAGRDVPHG